MTIINNEFPELSKSLDNWINNSNIENTISNMISNKVIDEKLIPNKDIILNDGMTKYPDKSMIMWGKKCLTTPIQNKSDLYNRCKSRLAWSGKITDMLYSTTTMTFNCDDKLLQQQVESLLSQYYGTVDIFDDSNDLITVDMQVELELDNTCVIETPHLTMTYIDDTDNIQDKIQQTTICLICQCAIGNFGLNSCFCN